MGTSWSSSLDSVRAARPAMWSEKMSIVRKASRTTAALATNRAAVSTTSSTSGSKSSTGKPTRKATASVSSEALRRSRCCSSCQNGRFSGTTRARMNRSAATTEKMRIPAAARTMTPKPMYCSTSMPRAVSLKPVGRQDLPGLSHGHARASFRNRQRRLCADARGMAAFCAGYRRTASVTVTRASARGQRTAAAVMSVGRPPWFMRGGRSGSASITMPITAKTCEVSSAGRRARCLLARRGRP